MGRSIPKNLASFGDLYINDAFSCSHRSHSSITGIPALLPSCAGLLMEKESLLEYNEFLKEKIKFLETELQLLKTKIKEDDK